MKNRAHESGQAIVIIMLLMTFLIGILGLVIDGGDLMYRYRKAVTTADAAALAGAVALCSGRDMYAAIEEIVIKNGLNFEDVTVTYPVTDRPDLGIPEEMIRVTITSEKEPYFIQLVWREKIFYSASTITSCNTTRTEDEPAIVYIIE